MSDDLQPLEPHEGVERFLRYRKPSVRPSTLNNAQTRLNHFLEWCDEREIENLNDLDGRDLADFVAWRQGDIAPITLQKQLSTVRAALEWWADMEAVDEGLREKVHSPDLPDGAESRDDHLSAERARAIIASLDRYHYASRDHALILLLWVTGMRRSAARSIDVDDLRLDDNAIVVENRPDTGTNLKNGDGGNRWVYLGPEVFQVIEDYAENPDRKDVVDDYGRRPLFTSKQGRPTGDTLYVWVNRATQPCQYGGCPHDRDLDECDALGHDGYPSRCPSSCGPHAIRRGSITHFLNAGTTPEIVSERMDVTLEVLYQHYDVRSDQEKMTVRKDVLDDSEVLSDDR
ncbi:integrase [Halorubrum salipaludis]|uniref:Integrase n=1 Tax=Halorubrum salipaludis TaxID=2032630 RepID=A0A2A2FIK1_9EURY|nr:tyrosine-type recombinase/integrase [Halorubrum salipaludis]PAU85311.1 integrase [Halorubrum salipaludis]